MSQTALTELVRRRIPLLLLALAMLAGFPSSAAASPTQESTFQDDNLLVYGSPAVQVKTLDVLERLGVDRIRVSVFWKIVAPSPASRRRPNFDAADPNAYPADNWDRYDHLILQAQARGIAVNLNPTSPVPLWATERSRRSDIAETHHPSAHEFELFVRALGRRYSGRYALAQPAPPSPPPSLFARQAQQPSQAPAPVLPRVDYWSIWNEPNQAGWLTPQWGASDGNRDSKLVEKSPRLYRDLADAAYSALVATGHEKDTILVGELAPAGLAGPKDARDKPETRSLRPLHFLRRLYCLDDRMRFFKGSSAATRGCPVGDQVQNFVRQHPVLFKSTGFAHHPYNLLFSPRTRQRNRDNVSMADLARLQNALKRVHAKYGQPKRFGVPLYLTEFGYQSNPPDPSQPFSPTRQAAYINEAEFMAYRNGRVRTLSQFLLYDDKPVSSLPRSHPGYWGTFQTGLISLSNRRKPAYNAYWLPIHVPVRAKRGRTFSVWGGLRTARGAGPHTATIEFKRRRSRRGFRALKTVRTTNVRGYFFTRVRVPGSGSLRIAFADPARRGKVTRSRSVSVRVR